MAKSKSKSKSFFSIGNCKVEVEGNVQHEQGEDELEISFSAATTLKITVEKPRRYATRSSHKEDLWKLQMTAGEELPPECSFVVLNPKQTNSQTKALLEEVFKLYSKELPMMSYCANTGKESPFVERCVTRGKYCSLVVKSDAFLGAEEVIAAVTYQIIPANTQYAEIPLAAVGKNYQRKGFGRLLFREVKKRLHDVGVLTLFCWGDQESEGFWLKQGFSTIAQVDDKGKAKRLPIKTDVRRAMSMPGNAMLLVSHLNGDNNVSGNAQIFTPPRDIKPCRFSVTGFDGSKSNTKASPFCHITTPVITESKRNLAKLSTIKCSLDEGIRLDYKTVAMDVDQSVTPEVETVAKAENVLTHDVETVAKAENVLKLSAAQDCLGNDKMDAFMNQHDIPVKLHDGQLDSTADMVNRNYEKNCGNSVLDFCMEGKICDCKAADNIEATLANSNNLEKVSTTCLCMRRGTKRSGLHEQLYSKSRKVNENDQNDASTIAEYKSNIQSMFKVNSGNVTPTNIVCTSREPLGEILLPIHTQFPISQPEVSNVDAYVLDPVKASPSNVVAVSAARIQQPVIMLMNMSDEKKRMHLTKIIENLGGTVSCNGNICTHIVTGQVRRTLNFCTALCAGAWVVSPEWLKASFRESKFVGEMPYVLKDKDFESKYGVKVEDVVLKASANPRVLLNDFHVYLTPHVQPQVEDLSAIIMAAGGKAVLSLEEVQNPSHAFALTCEEDMSEALAAAITGMPTYTSDWFMCCIMRQELDFTASQFTESL